MVSVSSELIANRLLGAPHAYTMSTIARCAGETLAIPEFAAEKLAPESLDEIIPY
jgi:hypothetical protein